MYDTKCFILPVCLLAPADHAQAHATQA